LWAVAAVLIIIIAAGAAGSSDDDSEPAASQTTAVEQSDPAEEPSEEPSEEPKATKKETEKPKPKPEPEPEPKPKPEEPRGQLGPVVAVLAVVDGDTVTVDYKGETTLRLIGIATPETVSPSVPDECYGPQASVEAHDLLDGEKVSLDFDGTQGRRDRYGRTLAYLTLPNGKDFGSTMIRKGYAIEYTYDAAYRHQADYQAAERKAKSADRGLWPKCGGADKPLHQPPKPDKKPDGGGGNNCASGYSPCLPPPGPDLNCPDVDGPIKVTGSDPYELDADGDGIACET